jgi:flavin reductase (DIM6/NTAB) family NADH-FMN oxidoreductase RutF
MERLSIPVDEYTFKPFKVFDKQWFLLTCGDFTKKRFNAMTISWGSLGVIWDKPFFQAVVRPSRYTFEFMNQYDTFTLCAFDIQYKSALNLLGSRSGREGDKIAESGLSPIASKKVAAPSFAEASLVFECKKMYWQDIDPAHFLVSDILMKYPKPDFHRAFFGEILAIEGCKEFAN